MRKFIFFALLFVCAACKPSDYEVIKIKLPNSAIIKAEVADTAVKQTQGLMYREQLDPDKGMIFPYTDEEQRSFWMKNTLIDLDIIFISKDKTINCIHKNVPHSTIFTPEDQVAVVGCPAQYVLELAAGAADKNKLSEGQKIDFGI